MTTELEQEAEKMRRVPGIVFAEGSFGRVPRIDGTGIEVFEVIGVYQGLDQDRRRLRKAFDFLTESQLEAALRYYEHFPEEVDERLADEARIFEKLKHERSGDSYHR